MHNVSFVVGEVERWSFQFIAWVHVSANFLASVWYFATFPAVLYSLRAVSFSAAILSVLSIGYGEI